MTRHCKGCDAVLPEEASVRAFVCSDRCRKRVSRDPALAAKYADEDAWREQEIARRKTARIEAQRSHYPPRTCGTCGHDFTPARNDSRYCSRACVDKRQRPVAEQARRRVRKNAAARTLEGRRKDAERKHRRRARKAFAVPQRWITSAHDADRCYWGGCELTDENRVVDHVMPIALGGPHDPTNTVPSCWDCNHEKRHKHPLVWLALQF